MFAVDGGGASARGMARKDASAARMYAMLSATYAHEAPRSDAPACHAIPAQRLLLPHPHAITRRVATSLMTPPNRCLIRYASL